MRISKRRFRFAVSRLALATSELFLRRVGAIAVMSRHGGGHVGIITGVDAQGNPIMISGNNGNRVREAPVSRGRIYAYVMPN